MTSPHDMIEVSYPPSAIPDAPNEKWMAYGWSDDGTSCSYGQSRGSSHAEAFEHARGLANGSIPDTDHTGAPRRYDHYAVVRLVYRLVITPTVFDVESGCGCGTTSPCTIDADVH